MERRREPRLAASESGVIAYGLAASIDCTIENTSALGACLEAGPATDCMLVPGEFVLFRHADRSMRNCRVIWRSFQRIGVEFK
jgi:hypothetical protein